MIPSMALPNNPVALNVEQINELNRKLSTMRHDVNNHLSLVMATVELIRCRPEDAGRLLNRLVEQPLKISESIAQFSRELESALNIKRP
jgi:hypothetical protein